MPHVVPLATLAVGLGMLGGAVGSIAQLGGDLQQTVPVVTQQDDLDLRFDRVRHRWCPRPDVAPPAPASDH